MTELCFLVKNLEKNFDLVNWDHVPREENKDADAACREAVKYFAVQNSFIYLQVGFKEFLDNYK
jgi:hypothetical protein